jgi:hypothetical protein
MSRPENFSILEVIEYLQGTCKTLQEGIQDNYPEMDESELKPDDLEELDNEIFNCTFCGWWCEIFECNDRSNEQVCDDCVDEEQEERDEEE